ncbi:Holliday junction DNA helicase RuvA [Candidatus Campbellbacteria bacterium RIFOXYC2_FULL_35_25]|uniref:Holliday junction branch migration complex subunit RuvA n=1 Tax=Candidatus Campbellbacteria bacterium RIFOXYC2_FULL_35_25 TaxID=1797582 RepID=A0A1F5EIU0_9BACT|nr:MAG: Holliday junction DNA helicase RuvA [Candidatus Campbellbacteria bacterium RIFOXYC2_FULL_35_25]
MISQLTGKITYKGDNFIIIDASSVGYKVFVPNDTIKEIDKLNTSDKKTTLWTHLAVRENSMDLFGFLTKEDLDFFELLISISGIGPKTALGILNVATTETLISAVSTGDTSYLTKVSGIGAKNAQKIVLELKNKVAKIEQTPTGIREEIDVIEALKSLGYSAREASDALKKIDKEIIGTSNKVREALKILSK